jgi:prepilin-type N-terminal cleavage/methylation domain-containing protein
MTGAKKIKNGFTILEMVIVMGIFSVASIYALSAYIKSNAGQKRIASTSKTITDARYALETMTREIRTGRLDYLAYYDKNIPLTNEPVNDLLIRDVNNRLVWFHLQTLASGQKEIRVCYTEQNCDDDIWSSITPNNSTITVFNVFIWPKIDPFAWNEETSQYNADQQPLVTLVISSKSLEPSDIVPTETTLQTSVSSRIYDR